MNRNARVPSVPKKHEAVGIKWMQCPKCGERTEGTYNATGATDVRLVPKPHIRGNQDWCYPQGIPQGIKR